MSRRASPPCPPTAPCAVALAVALALAGVLALAGCAPLAPRSPAQRLADDLMSGSEEARQIAAGYDSDSKREVARALTLELCAAAGRDPERAALAGRTLAVAGVDAVSGAAAALEQRDQQLEIEIAAGRAPRDDAKGEQQANVPYTPAEIRERVSAFTRNEPALVAELSSALAALGRPAVTDLLAAASETYAKPLPPLRRPAPLMRDVADAALQAIGEPALPELVEAIRYPRLRAAAARAMSAAGPEGLRLLLNALELPSQEVSSAARAALTDAVRREAPVGSERAELLSRARRALSRRR